jgi:AcrR family transcriptional regulator
MTKTEGEKRLDITTEQKLKEAARRVFTQKGYTATRVRDIANEAGINLALVNYYFRSKEKLFQLIMAETIEQLFETIKPVIDDETTTLAEKLSRIVDHYIDLLFENPDLPLFVVNELMSASDKLPMMTDNGNIFFNSVLARQLWALYPQGKINFHPVNIMVNTIGMIVFPFIARNMFLRSGRITEVEFRAIIEERKKLIPMWVTQMANL